MKSFVQTLFTRLGVGKYANIMCAKNIVDSIKMLVGEDTFNYKVVEENEERMLIDVYDGETKECTLTYNVRRGQGENARFVVTQMTVC